MSQSATASQTHDVPHVHGPHCSHEPQQPYRREEPRIGRNDPCHCGSGKKFKKCHGGVEAIS